MPKNANTYNTRITSEALEAAFRERFPAQGGAELVDDLYASGVIQPVFDLSTTTAGGALPQQLQTAFDFATGNFNVTNTTTTIITNTGFWLVDMQYASDNGTISSFGGVQINDGSSTKPVVEFCSAPNSTAGPVTAVSEQAVVFLRAGDSLEARTTTNAARIVGTYRQIADVNGNLVNPLGFTFS